MATSGTPQEEIDRQHKRAVELIDVARCPYSNCSWRSEIPLEQKVCPTRERFDNNDENRNQGNAQSEVDAEVFPCWSSRGRVDVAALQLLVREGYNQSKGTTEKSETHSETGDSSSCSSSSTSQNGKRRMYKASDVVSKTNLWDPINAAVNNVSIVRPSHDAWGINKIVLIFADDFLRDVYELPWWHGRGDIRNAVQPILDVLQIAPENIVRLLLAALPPGVTIPIHHDSGEWVKHTHRVHAPVLVKNPDRILFQCGLTEDRLERIDCTPGHVFEINNQGRHTVSNCDEDHRVHLILDYVDDQRLAAQQQRERIRLRPGEILLQTRRSIDRLSDKGQRPTPSFLILGAQKAGTTSLYEYIVQHPLVVRARRRETHCLDWRWNDALETTAQRRNWCHQFYLAKELELHPSCLTGDSTPSYLLDSVRVIPRLKQVFDWPIKFFVMLREPVTRAESHYAMVTSTEGTAAQMKARGTEWRSKSFRQVVLEDFHKMKDCGLIPYWNIEEGTLDETLLEEFTGSKQEDEAWDRYLSNIPLNTGSHSLISRGLYELNIRPWLRAFDRSSFLVLRLDELKDKEKVDDYGGIQTTMARVWKHLNLPEVKVRDTSPKNSRKYAPIIDEELKQYLHRFYSAHNRRLEGILGEAWYEVWK